MGKNTCSAYLQYKKKKKNTEKCPSEVNLKIFSDLWA